MYFNNNNNHDYLAIVISSHFYILFKQIFMMTKQCSTVIPLSVSASYTIQVCSEAGSSSTSCCIIVETAISSGIYKD